MNKFKVILQGKCPRCRKGDLFVYPAHHYSKFQQMHTDCKCCGVNFYIEPGFYFGAMYFSYAFVVAIVFIESSILYFVFGDPDMLIYLSINVISILLLLPFFFRYSRILFLHLFGGISFDPSAKLKNC